jgi:hypothetical protein
MHLAISQSYNIPKKTSGSSGGRAVGGDMAIMAGCGWNQSSPFRWEMVGFCWEDSEDP